MKQLLFLLIFPCLALAQYQNNGNQKITLGEQSTADGLVYRGVENDTALITPLGDTSAYIILDTVNNKFYNYNRSTNVWSLAGGGGGSTLDTATMLLPYWRSGRFSGVLPIVNGGTGQTTLAAAGIITGSGTNNRFTIFNGSTTITNSNIYRQSVGGEDYMGINVSDPSNYSYLVIGGNGGGQYALVKGTKMFGYFASEANSGTGLSDTTLSIGNFVRGADISIFTRPAVSGGATNKLYIKNNGNVGIGTASPTARIHLSAGTASASSAPLKFTSGTNLTTAEAGAMEFNGTNLFFSPSTTRHTVNHGLTGSATLDFPSTGALFAADLTVTVTGAADGDVVSLGVPNASVNANTCYTAWVSAANTVTVRFNNYSSGTLNPASGTFKVFVTK